MANSNQENNVEQPVHSIHTKAASQKNDDSLIKEIDEIINMVEDRPKNTSTENIHIKNSESTDYDFESTLDGIAAELEEIGASIDLNNSKTTAIPVTASQQVEVSDSEKQTNAILQDLDEIAADTKINTQELHGYFDGTEELIENPNHEFNEINLANTDTTTSATVVKNIIHFLKTDIITESQPLHDQSFAFMARFFNKSTKIAHLLTDIINQVEAKINPLLKQDEINQAAVDIIFQVLSEIDGQIRSDSQWKNFWDEQKQIMQNVGETNKDILEIEKNLLCGIRFAVSSNLYKERKDLDILTVGKVLQWYQQLNTAYLDGKDKNTLLTDTALVQRLNAHKNMAIPKETKNTNKAASSVPTKQDYVRKIRTLNSQLSILANDAIKNGSVHLYLTEMQAALDNHYQKPHQPTANLSKSQQVNFDKFCKALTELKEMPIKDKYMTQELAGAISKIQLFQSPIIQAKLTQGGVGLRINGAQSKEAESAINYINKGNFNSKAELIHLLKNAGITVDEIKMPAFIPELLAEIDRYNAINKMQVPAEIKQAFICAPDSRIDGGNYAVIASEINKMLADPRIKYSHFQAYLNDEVGKIMLSESTYKTISKAAQVKAYAIPADKQMSFIALSTYLKYQFGTIKEYNKNSPKHNLINKLLGKDKEKLNLKTFTEHFTTSAILIMTKDSKRKSFIECHQEMLSYLEILPIIKKFDTPQIRATLNFGPEVKDKEILKFVSDLTHYSKQVDRIKGQFTELSHKTEQELSGLESKLNELSKSFTNTFHRTVKDPTKVFQQYKDCYSKIKSIVDALPSKENINNLQKALGSEDNKLYERAHEILERCTKKLQTHESLTAKHATNPASLHTQPRPEQIDNNQKSFEQVAPTIIKTLSIS